ncbi:Hypothetical predicted protein [Podarcis lilfordi]|uniref:Uncharacterized protein n=1 Tax=Podarcis lilfordi TaxID=74358 RepID=A0AA35P2F7_9SAUR|nr:Hypothetical predicted protein [Podarcis lilfordi]
MTIPFYKGLQGEESIRLMEEPSYAEESFATTCKRWHSWGSLAVKRFDGATGSNSDNLWYREGLSCLHDWQKHNSCCFPLTAVTVDAGKSFSCYIPAHPAVLRVIKPCEKEAEPLAECLCVREEACGWTRRVATFCLALLKRPLTWGSCISWFPVLGRR